MLCIRRMVLFARDKEAMPGTARSAMAAGSARHFRRVMTCHTARWDALLFRHLKSRQPPLLHYFLPTKYDAAHDALPKAYAVKEAAFPARSC